jgi:hypothetical protein
MWRRMSWLIVLSLAGAVVGAAASLTVSAGSLGARSTVTPRCTNAALTVFQNLSAGTVVSVTVSGLPAGCGGATLQATVNNGTVNGSGSAIVPGAGGSVTVALATAPSVTAAMETDLVLVGP